MKEITVIVPNKVGALAEVAEELGSNGINIISISAMGVGDTGVIRLITSDERSAMNVLTKYTATKRDHYEVRMADAIVVSIHDRPGELSKICKKIAKLGVNIETVYQMKKEGGMTDLVIKPERVEEALKALKEAGIKARL